jgi:hypothetical protein
MATYTAERAKSGRAACKKCKEKIEKDDCRIGVHRKSPDDIVFTSWNHLKCFNIPKKTNADEFLESIDMSELNEDDKEMVRSTLLVEVVTATPGSKRKSTSSTADDSGKKIKFVISNIFHIQCYCNYSIFQGIDEESLTPEEQAAFNKYKSLTVDQLKDFMRWNNQQIGGTKVIYNY